MGWRVLFMWSAALKPVNVESKDCSGRWREPVLCLTCQWFCCFDSIMYVLLRAPAANQRLKTAAVRSLTVAATHNPTHSWVRSATKQLCLSFIHLNPTIWVILTLGELQQFLIWLLRDPLDCRGRKMHVLQPIWPCNLYLPSRRTQRNLSWRPSWLALGLEARCCVSINFWSFVCFKSGLHCLQISLHLKASCWFHPCTLFPQQQWHSSSCPSYSCGLWEVLEKQEPTCECSFQT